MYLVLDGLILLLFPRQECTLRIVALVANWHSVVVIVLFEDHQGGVMGLGFNCWSHNLHRAAVLIYWFHESGSLDHAAQQAALIVVLGIVKLASDCIFLWNYLLSRCVFFIEVIIREKSIHFYFWIISAGVLISKNCGLLLKIVNLGMGMLLFNVKFGWI